MLTGYTVSLQVHYSRNRSFGNGAYVLWGKLGKIHQFIKLFYFSTDLKNEIKSFDAAINHPIAEVLPGGAREQRGVQGIIVAYH